MDDDVGRKSVSKRTLHIRRTRPITSDVTWRVRIKGKEKKKKGKAHLLSPAQEVNPRKGIKLGAVAGQSARKSKLDIISKH